MGDMQHGTCSTYSNHGCRCDACRTAQQRHDAARYLRDKERIIAQKVEYHRTERGREVLGRAKTKYLKTAKGRAASRRGVAKWQRTPDGKAHKRKELLNRKALKRAAFIEKVDPATVYEMHGGRCGICGEFVRREQFHVDHVIPLSRGGRHGYINVQPAHPACNSKKCARLPHELAEV